MTKYVINVSVIFNAVYDFQNSYAKETHQQAVQFKNAIEIKYKCSRVEDTAQGFPENREDLF